MKYPFGHQLNHLTERVVGLLFLLVSASLSFGLMDRTYEFILEPDFDITRINMYRELLSNFSFRQFTPPFPQPYFDGAYIVYAVIATAVAKLAPHLQWLRDLLPNSDSYGLFAAELTNAGATMLAGWVFYRSMIQLGTGTLVGFLLALLLCLSPQLLHINLIRIDHFIVLPLVAVFHISLMITLGKARRYHAIVLGLAMALLVNLKLSCIVFAAFPVLAIAAVLARQRDYGTIIGLARFTVAAGVPFVVVTPLLMARFLALGATGFMHHCLMSLHEIQKWTAVLPLSPRFYYNIDLFSDYGTLFLVIVAASAAIALAHAIVIRHPVGLFLTASLTLFSALGVMAFKYDRGGYHLIPIYLAEVGFLAAMVRSRFARVGVRRSIASTITLGFLAIPAANAWAVYEDEIANVAAREVTIDRTRRQPRNWLSYHVPPGSKVCLMRHSDWASVPMQDLHLKVTYGPLDLPYLDREALVRYPVPSIAEVAAQCDIAILNNFHKSMYASTFHYMDLDRKWREWQELFEKMAEIYPPVLFTSDVPAHGVSRIEIYDLRTTK